MNGRRANGNVERSRACRCSRNLDIDRNQSQCNLNLISPFDFSPQQSEVASTLEDQDQTLSTALDDRKMQQYGNLFFLLQSEPRHTAQLCRLVSLAEIDTLLQTVMFTLYGNQYESREEHLLLTMFQVSV